MKQRFPSAFILFSMTAAVGGMILLPSAKAEYINEASGSTAGDRVDDDLTVAGNLTIDGTGLFKGGLDFGNAGEVQLNWVGANNAATFDLLGTGSFIWGHDLLTASKNKMLLNTANVLTLFKSDGTTAGISLEPATGKINLPASGGGIYFGGSSIAALTGGTGGSAVFGNGLESTTLSVTSSSTSALSMTGGLNGVHIGRGAGANSTNTVLGFQPLVANTSGYENTGVGSEVLKANTTGYRNTAIGSLALRSNVSGLQNTAMGYGALYSNTTAGYNTAVGSEALKDTTSGGTNVAIGARSLWFNTSGGSNVGIGTNSLQSNIDGHQNTASGSLAMIGNVSGSNNVAYGYEALYSHSNGDLNVAIGSKAGRYYGAAPGTLPLTNGRANIYIGANVRGNAVDDFNAIAIGTGALSDGTNKTVIGTSSTTSTKLFGSLSAGSGSATGISSFSSGTSTSGGHYSAAVGNSTASGSHSLAAGNSTASGTHSFAAGNSTASGYQSFAAGSSTASHSNSVSFGNLSISAANGSFAVGSNSVARTVQEAVVGRFNIESSASPIGWRETDGLFRVGNGTESVRSDALTVIKNGQTTLTNKAWKNRDTGTVTATEDPTPAETDAGGEALVVEGHTRLKGKVIIEVPQGDISMGIYGEEE